MDDTEESTDQKQIYHEKQKRQLCAMHVLNNLFQKRNTFTKTDMDNICTRLSPQHFMNPHRSMLGLGNYDVNVIMAALQTKDLCTIWFDKRKCVKCLNLTSVKGIIVNIPTDIGIGFVKLPFNFKHWFVIREINGEYYNLDSKLSAPNKLGSGEKTLEYLHQLVTSGGKELLLVVDPEVEKSGDWVTTEIKSETNDNFESFDDKQEEKSDNSETSDALQKEKTDQSVTRSVKHEEDT